MRIKGTVNPQQGVVGKVSINPANRTTVASPNFEPKINLELSDLIDINADIKSDGAVVVYDSTTSEYVVKQIDVSSININSIVGGRF